MSEKKKVMFIKNHVNGIKKGDVESYDVGRADYLVRVKVAEYVTEEPNTESKKSVTKEVKESKLKSGKTKGGNDPCKTC